MNYNTVYVGMDVHKESFTLCSCKYEDEKASHYQRTPASYKNVLRYLAFLRTIYGEDTRFVCGYEAGYLGYSLYHQLENFNVECVILAPTTMLEQRSKRRIKTDKRDAEIIAKSPVRLTVAGMGDALATYFEARACQRSEATSCAGGNTTGAAMALAELCFDTLMEEGVKAKIALEAGVCTPAVEKIIEANTLLSGIGFESAGLAGAHAIHNGLTVLEECHHMYHGEKVAFGTLAQLVLENVPHEELEEIIMWCIEVGLPVTLEELGAGNVTDEQLMEVAKAASAEGDTLQNMPFTVTPESVFAAIKAADAYGRYYLGEE